MRWRPLLVAIGVLLMLASAIVPPVRYVPPPAIILNPNFENFTEELEGQGHNVTEDCWPAQRIIVTCHIRSDEELENVMRAMNEFPHKAIMFYGYGETDVVVFNESEFYAALPATCEPLGTVRLKPVTAEQNQLKKELEAYRELEGLIDDPTEGEFIHNHTVKLEKIVESGGKWRMCNATFAHIILTYPVRRESNVPMMVALWSGVILIGLVGLVMAWKERKT